MPARFEHPRQEVLVTSEATEFFWRATTGTAGIGRIVNGGKTETALPDTIAVLPFVTRAIVTGEPRGPAHIPKNPHRLHRAKRGEAKSGQTRNLLASSYGIPVRPVANLYRHCRQISLLSDCLMSKW